MNVYDFDKTIFYPDSTVTLLKFLLKRFPRVFYEQAEVIALGIWKHYKTGDPTPMKEAALSVLSFVPDIDALVEEFWEENLCRIARWYLDRKKPDDLIISASPEFHLRPLADMLGIALIATPTDKYSGRITGINCSGEEKVRRFLLEYPGEQIDEFYSDSLSDEPLARMAKKAFLVKGGHRITPWPFKD